MTSKASTIDQSTGNTEPGKRVLSKNCPEFDSGVDHKTYQVKQIVSKSGLSCCMAENFSYIERCKSDTCGFKYWAGE